MSESKTFTYIKYDEIAIAQQEAFKKKFEEIEELMSVMGAGREQSLVATNLEVAYMWVGKAIRNQQFLRNSQAQHLPERG